MANLPNGNFFLSIELARYYADDGKFIVVEQSSSVFARCEHLQAMAEWTTTFVSLTEHVALGFLDEAHGEARFSHLKPL